MSILSKVADCIDFDVTFICKDEDEGRALGLQLAIELGLTNPDIVFIEHHGIMSRVQVRSYAHKPGVLYGWLERVKEAGCNNENNK